MPMLLFSRTSINFYKFKIIIIIATVKIIFELLTTKVVVPIHPLKNESSTGKTNFCVVSMKTPAAPCTININRSAHY